MYFLILLKYGYPRDLWIQECQKNGLAQTDHTLSVEQMVSKLSAMLRKVILKLDGWWECDAATAWVRNCGKNVSQVLGPVPFLCALGVIVKDKRTTRTNSTGILRFGLSGHKFRLATSASQTKKLQKTLEAIVRGSQAWACIVKEPPRDLIQWGKLMRQMNKSLMSSPSMPLMQNSTKYVYKWVARNLFFMAMKMKGIGELKLQQDITGRALDANFPDSQGWGKRFAANGKGKLKLKALFRDLHFEEGAEFFSMRTCQFASKDLDVCAPAEITRKRASLESLMQKYRKRHKQWPAPHELVSVAMQEKVL